MEIRVPSMVTNEMAGNVAFSRTLNAPCGRLLSGFRLFSALIFVACLSDGRNVDNFGSCTRNVTTIAIDGGL